MGPRYFEIQAPAEWVSPIVYNSPHSGTILPDDLVQQSRLTPEALRQSEDCFVDELFGTCLNFGAPMLRALVSRAYIDFNREPYELDPKMFHEELPGYMNPDTSRVAGGLGTIPKIVAENADIYRGKISLAEAQTRINQVYRPYHRTLTALLDEVHGATQFCLLVDCHSMPASAVRHLRSHHEPAIDIVLGDRFGSSCNSEISHRVEALLTNEGFVVVRNRPYAGGFITATHGSPHQNRHALQIEINRALYLDEARLEKNSNFEPVKTALARVMQSLAQFLPTIEQATSQRLAAE
ncbi:MAG: N-formylglutamate amidohydrolase [Alphaproteobacteria bacterium]|nr:N-formylglutamate amidohydrolase [Alphaproteobacteria bacterium]